MRFLISDLPILWRDDQTFSISKCVCSVLCCLVPTSYCNIYCIKQFPTTVFVVLYKLFVNERTRA